jgi:major vault protein
MDSVVTIPPLHYCHVLNANTNVVRVETGPLRLTLSSEELMERRPTPFITVPPRHYVKVYDHVSNRHTLPYKNNFGRFEVRVECEPFPLYPNETISAIEPLPVIPEGVGLHLVALEDGRDREGIFRSAGEEWVVMGPMTYTPREGEDVVRQVLPETVLLGEGLHLTATSSFIDRFGASRTVGDVWMITQPGSYLLHVFEKKVAKVSGIVLSPEKALYVKVERAFTDLKKERHRAGDMWLVTSQYTEVFIPPPEVKVTQEVAAIHVDSLRYCLIGNPYDPVSRRNHVGMRVVREGPATFFLFPGEKIISHADKYQLQSEDALLLAAKEDFLDRSDASADPILRRAGTRWMIRGPRSYCPPIEVSVIEERKAIPLSETEGIYVKNIYSGEIRLEMGVQSYLLKADEELWEKHLSEEVELILKGGGGIGSPDIRKLQYFSDNVINSDGPRDLTRAVTLKIPSAIAVQVVDLKSRSTRVVFGPSLIVLQPFEEFTILRYSAGKPKRPGALVSVCLLLGPDIITDVFQVETEDHARLQIKLAASYEFQFDRSDPSHLRDIFSVNDFIGDTAKLIASQVRSMVARTPLEDFHRNSSQMINDAVFGVQRQPLRCSYNHLVISDIDVQHVEVIDETARALLFKSVQLAIDTTTKAMENTSMHQARLQEQEAEGVVKRERYRQEAEAEKMRQSLVAARVDNALLDKIGHVHAAEKADAEVSKIEGETLVLKARARSDAHGIINEMEEKILQDKAAIERELRRKEIELELERESHLASIEAHRFQYAANALGPSTIQAIAGAEMDTKVKLLQSLGLQGIVVSSGRNPLNLNATANGLIGFKA